ncbi:methyltransferase (DUF5641) [Popillia japonica]|uniref:Methyltransferase (DUF5641) n=1 Tax=Popillia japonica TaxID=7064 RepID=A0AAW1LAS3_POPJA
MQQRNKWIFDSPGGVQVGDLVLLKEDNVPPLKWIMGRIIEVHPGQDGRNRVVTIKTAQGTVDRGVQKVCCFPSGSRCTESVLLS